MNTYIVYGLIVIAVLIVGVILYKHPAFLKKLFSKETEQAIENVAKVADEGLTEAHIQKWGWNVNENGWVNFPDYQWRIYRNDKRITWINKVHEVLSEYVTVAELPADPEYALIHNKTIDRQERQNAYYDTL